MICILFLYIHRGYIKEKIMGNLTVGKTDKALAATRLSRVLKTADIKTQSVGILNFASTNMNKDELLNLINDIVSNENLDTELKIKLLWIILDMLEKYM